MAVAEIPVASHLTGTGVQELRNLRLWQKTSTPSSPTEGIFWYDSNTGNKRIYFYDGSAAVKVPRLDRAESLTGQWSFDPGSSQAPFVLGSNAQGQLVTGLNADLLDGTNSDSNATASTVAVRDSSARLKAADPVASLDVVNLQYLTATLTALSISASQITSGILPLVRGGTGADLLAAGATGGLVYKETSSNMGITAALTGILFGNGGVAPTALAVLPVTLGGTNATTAAGARTNLELLSESQIIGIANQRMAGGGLTANANSTITGTAGLTFGVSDFTVIYIVSATAFSGTNSFFIRSHSSGNSRVSVGWQPSPTLAFGASWVNSGGTTTVTAISSLLVPNVNETNHVAFRADRDGNLEVYLNGILIGSVDISAHVAVDVGNGNANPFIALATTGYTCYGIQVYSRLLSAAEIALAARRRFVPPSEANCILDLEVETANPAISTTIKDRSSSVNHATTTTNLSPNVKLVQLNAARVFDSALTANTVTYAGTGGELTGIGLNATATTKFLTQVSSGTPAWTDLFGGTNSWTVSNSFSGSITVPTPVSANDAASKAYVDSVAGTGLRPLAECQLATTANVTLSGEQTIDGVLTSASRILVKSQTAPAENGIYVTAAGAWSRSTDCDAAAEITKGAYTFVSAGTANAGTSWYQTLTVTTINTDPVTWVKFFQQAAYIAGTGITIGGLTISVNQAFSPSWTGAHTFTNSGGVTLGPHGASAGNTTELRFLELAANGSNYVGFKAPDTLSANKIWVLPSADGSADYYIKTNGSGALSFAQIASAEVNNSTFVTSVSGTTNRITITGTLTPVVDIASTYVGQATITTLGTITTGTWSANAIAATRGGTGQTAWAVGDLVYSGTINSLTGLSISGTNTRFLQSNGTVPGWSAWGLPTTMAANSIIVGSSTSATTTLATTASRIMTTDSSGNLQWTATIPAGITIAGDTNNKVPKLRWFNVGDGSSTTITLTHSFGTTDIVVQVYEVSTGSTVHVAVTRATSSTVAIEFVTAPSLNAYRAAIICQS